MAAPKSKIIFLGTPEFAVPVLVNLIKSNLTPILVITQPDKPVGRKKELIPSPIKEVALKNNIPVAQPVDKKELKEVLENYNYDVCILVAYGMIIPKDYLTKSRGGFLNIHPSLLPLHRGSSPIQTALLNGDKKTGVTIIKLTNEVDAGPIIAQKEVEIKPNDNAEILHNKLSKVGADLLVQILPDYLAGKTKAKIQNESQASFTQMIKREDGQIDWQKSAIEIERQFKAFYPWPGTFTYLGKKRLKITNLGVLEGDFDPNLSPGEVFLGPNQELTIKCGKGVINLILLQLEGRKETSGQDFLRGQKDLIGKKL